VGVGFVAQGPSFTERPTPAALVEGEPQAEEQLL